ncbi:MAG: type IV pilus twitching motility protein PilT [Candidatus Omnitrophica bacterium]|nr:type IV pilus twitching motility protein PilT [Candidatus Omnitrophota bacterium]
MEIDLIELLRSMVLQGASDAHFKTNRSPVFRIKKELISSSFPVLENKDLEKIAYFMMRERHRNEFEKKNEIDFSYHLPDVGRFRVNVFRQRGDVGIVMRVVKSKIPSFDDLLLPPQVCKKISMFERGIVLITGASSMGKSTTLAAMIDYINQNRKCHIMTIEDPIEYLHEDKQALINQREVGLDTESFNKALRYVIRQDPDIVLIGEMRDAETFQTALSASETGHLVFSTLHASDTAQVVDRIMDFFPTSQHEMVRMQLSFNLRAVTCQRLMPRADGTGVVPALEVMIVNPTVTKLIRENKTERLNNTLQSFSQEGMLTFNQSLVNLVKSKLITLDVALANSSNPEALQMNLKGIYLDEDRRILGE